MRAVGASLSAKRVGTQKLVDLRCIGEREAGVKLGKLSLPATSAVVPKDHAAGISNPIHTGQGLSMVGGAGIEPATLAV